MLSGPRDAYAFLHTGPGTVQCSRIYHVLSNLLSMLKNIFMALSPKLYLWDFLEDTFVLMPDISS